LFFDLLSCGLFAFNYVNYCFIFFFQLMPDHPDLVANYITLSVLTFLFLFIAWALLRRQERYI